MSKVAIPTAWLLMGISAGGGLVAVPRHIHGVDHGGIPRECDRHTHAGAVRCVSGRVCLYRLSARGAGAIMGAYFASETATIESAGTGIGWPGVGTVPIHGQHCQRLWAGYWSARRKCHATMESNATMVSARTNTTQFLNADLPARVIYSI